MQMLALVLILNAPGGHELRALPAMPADDCRAAMHAIWQAPFPTVANDAKGKPLPAVDAYCETPSPSRKPCPCHTRAALATSAPRPIVGKPEVNGMNMHITAGDAVPVRNALSARAMLAGLTIAQWSGRKLDRQVTDETNRAHGAAADAGRFNKSLVSRDALAEIVSIANGARKEHYARTLPWHDDGNRILSASGYQAYTAAMRALRIKFDDAVYMFLRDYPSFVVNARARLNGMFHESDYPDASEIATRFRFRTDLWPMPDAADFRVDVGDDAAAAIRADITARTEAAVDAAMRDVFTRVSDAVGRMAEKLSATRETHKGDAAAIFRDSLVENVRELVNLLPSLNISAACTRPI